MSTPPTGEFAGVDAPLLQASPRRRGDYESGRFSLDSKQTSMAGLRPRLFIGSAGEVLRHARSLASALRPKIDAVVWPEIFKAADYTLEALAREVLRADAALLLFTPADALRLRAKAHEAVRDNVIFEFGLFTGHLGRKASFYLIPSPLEKLRIPTDLSGLTAFTYDAKLFAKRAAAAMKIAAATVKERVVELTTASGGQASLTGDWLQNWHFSGSKNFGKRNPSPAKVLNLGSRFRATFKSKRSVYIAEGDVTERLITGTWRDIRRGGSYYGSFQLAILSNGAKLVGKWIGHREDSRTIETGTWAWTRA